MSDLSEDDAVSLALSLLDDDNQLPDQPDTSFDPAAAAEARADAETRAERRNQRHLWPSALPYPCESLAEFDERLDHCVRRIIDAIYTQECVADPSYPPFGVALYIWVRYTENLLALNYPLRRSTRARLGRLTYHAAVELAMPSSLLKSLVGLVTRLIDSQNRIDIRHLVLPFRPLWDSIKDDLLSKERHSPLSSSVVYRLNLALVARRFFDPEETAVIETLDCIVRKLDGTSIDHISLTHSLLVYLLPIHYGAPNKYLPLVYRLWDTFRSIHVDSQVLHLLADVSKEVLRNPESTEATNLKRDVGCFADPVEGLPSRKTASTASTPALNEEDVDMSGVEEEPDAGIKAPLDPDARASMWRDIGIFTEDQFRHVMTKALRLAGAPVGSNAADNVQLQAQSSLALVGEDGRLDETVSTFKLPRSEWQSLARIIVYSIAPDGPVHSYEQHRSATHSAVQGGERTYLGGSRAIEHLATFILATEGFFHPLNTGHWQLQLMMFIPQLASNFIQRVWYERSPKSKVLPRYRLTDAAIEAVVRVLKPVCLLSMFSKDRKGQSNARLALRSLAALRPDLIVPDILQRSISSLEALETTARTKAILTTLVDLAPVILSREVYPAGAKHLPSLLALCLPGIDPNDSSKTISTAMLFFTVCLGIKVDDLTHPDYDNLRVKAEGSVSELVALVETDESGTPSDKPPTADASEEQKKAYRLAHDRWVREATADLEPWAIEFLRRILSVFESLADETATGAEVSWRDKSENQLVNVLCSAYGAVVQSMGPRVLKNSFEVLLEFLSQNPTIKRDPYTLLVGNFAAVAPEMVLDALVPRCIDAVDAELASGAATIATTKTSREIEADTMVNWHLSILLGATKRGGVHLLKHRDALLGFLHRLIPRARSETTYFLGASLVARLLSSLAGTYPIEEHFLNLEQWSDPLIQATSSDFWGKAYKLKDVKIEWHMPSPAEIEFALEILDQVGTPAVEGVESLLSNPVFVSSATGSKAGTPRPEGTPRSATPVHNRSAPSLSANLLGQQVAKRLAPSGTSTPVGPPGLALGWSSDLCRLLAYLGYANAALTSFLELPQTGGGKEAETYTYADQSFIAYPPHLQSGFILRDPEDPRYVRAIAHKNNFRDVLVKVVQFVRAHQEQMQVDTVGWILHAVESYLTSYGTDRHADRQLLSRTKMVRDYSHVYPYDKAYPRAYWVARAELYHGMRQRNNAFLRTRTPTDDLLIEFVTDQALDGYDNVRSVALDILEAVIARFNGVTVLLLPRLFNVLRNPASEEALKGALIVLGTKEFRSQAWFDTRFVLDYIVLHFEAQRQSDPRIQEAARLNIDDFADRFPEWATIRRDIPLSRELVEALRIAEQSLPPPYRVADEALRTRVRDLRLLRGDKIDEVSPKLVDAVLEFTEVPEIHWFYKLAAHQLLTKLVRRDKPLDPRVAAYFAERVPTSEGEQLSVSAVSGLAKVLYYAKIQTMAHTPLDVLLSKTHNPLRHVEPLPSPVPIEEKERYFDQFSGPLTPESQLARHVRSRWLLWPKDNVYYTVPAKGTGYPFDWSESTMKAIEAVESVVKAPSWWVRLSELWSQEKSAEYSYESTMLIKSLFIVYGVSLLEPVKPVFESLLAARDDADKQQAAAELLAGILRGSKHWSIEARDQLYAWLEPLLPQFLVNTALDSRDHWQFALEYGLGNNDPRRNGPLVQAIIERGLDVYADNKAAAKDEASTTATVEALSNLSEVLIGEAPMLRPVLRVIANRSLDNFSRDATQVRQLVATNLNKATAELHYPSFGSLDALLAASRTGKGSLVWQPDTPRKYLAKIHEKLTELRPLRIPTSQGTSEYDHLANTTLLWISEQGLTVVNRGVEDAIIDFVPDLFEMSEIHDNDLIVAGAKAMLAFVNTANHSQERAEHLITVILDAVQSSSGSWRLRQYALASLQVIYFLNLYNLPATTAERIIDQILTALSDPQPEVAEMAATTLSGIVRCSQGELLDRLRERFESEVLANALLPPRSDPGFSGQLARLHSALLGACALVTAFPYDIPPWMPDLLVETIAPHTDDPNPVAKTVRKCASDFRRTHQDTWQEDQKRFTHEQLQEVLDFTHGRADYFA